MAIATARSILCLGADGATFSCLTPNPVNLLLIVYSKSLFNWLPMLPLGLYLKSNPAFYRSGCACIE